MLDIFTHLLDLVFPPHPSVKKLRGVTLPLFRHHYCLLSVYPFIALSSYQDELINAAITANKFHNSKQAAHLLASLLTHYLATLPPKPTILVPIPLSLKRKRERGYNQITRVLKLVDYPNTIYKPLLSKVRETTPQTQLKRTERLKNLTDAFVFKNNNEIPVGCRIILVDDVITTGATMRAARAALAPPLPPQTELICVGLAH